MLVRRVVGLSMVPTLKPGHIVVARRFKGSVRRGDVVVIRHDNMDKLKRVTQLRDDKIFVVGDNASKSVDSRHFGWIDQTTIRGKVIWPTPQRKKHL